MREGQPSRALPEYLTKEILRSRICRTVQAGEPMTVKEMKPVRALTGFFPFRVAAQLVRKQVLLLCT